MSDEAEMEDNGNLLSHPGLWDDHLLTKAYDRAVQLAKECVYLQEQEEERAAQVEQELSKKRDLLKLGDKCFARYYGDAMYYQARVEAISPNRASYTVCFSEYGSRQECPAADIYPIGTETKATRRSRPSGKGDVSKARHAASEPEPGEILDQDEQQAEYEECSTQHQEQIEPTALLMSSLVTDTQNQPTEGVKASESCCFPEIKPPLGLTYPIEDEALLSMLSSWYMSGFYTGYYKGLLRNKDGGATAADQPNADM